MTTIEELLNTIEELNDIAAKALDLVDEWGLHIRLTVNRHGGELETAKDLRERLEQIIANCFRPMAQKLQMK